MIEKLHIRNFQSHKDSTVNFSPGLNVIIGANQNGKTAIIRALKKLLRDTPLGTSFITVGESTTIISGTTDTGVEATRTVYRSKTGSLVVAGETYSGFKGTIPQEAMDAMGVSNVYPIADDTIKIDFNFRDQHKAGFFINLADSAKSKLVGAIARLDVFDIALRKGKSLVSALRLQEKQLSTAWDQANQRVTEIDKVLANKLTIDGLRGRFNDLKERMDTVVGVEKLLYNLQQVSITGRNISKALKDTKNTDTLPSSALVLADNVQQYATGASILNSYYTIMDNIVSIEEVDTIDSGKLEVDIDTLIAKVTTASILSKIMSSLVSTTMLIASTEQDIIKHDVMIARDTTIMEQQIASFGGLCPTCGQQWEVGSVLCGGAA